jgi:phosphinothricin acetyltransferase
MIRPVKLTDAKYLKDIYNYYVTDTVVTFEEEPVSTVDMEQQIEAALENDLPWFVAESDGVIRGYAHANKWKGRCAYRYTVEVTAYLSHLETSRGWGTSLYNSLFAELKNKSTHAVIGGIALPNPASIALHEKFGMTKVGQFNEVGYKFNQWVDVGYWHGTL